MNLIPNPMLDLLQVIPFFITLFGMYLILFKPLREYLDHRNDSIDGALNEAKSIKDSTEEKISKLESELKAARHEAAVIRNKALSEGVSEYNNQIAKEREEAQSRTADAIKVIEGETSKATSTLNSEANDIATQIATQVLGRSLA